MEAMIRVDHLSKTFTLKDSTVNALKNVSFTVSEGEMVAIMGPSGSGKSTLLYTASGMDNVTSGEVRFGGEELSKLSENALSELRLDEMGFIFQQMYMLKNLTVLDNIVLPAVQSKKNNAAKQEKLEQLPGNTLIV